MSDTTTISASERERVGKGSARAARRAGLVPAVIYGNKQDPVGITMESREITKIVNQPVAVAVPVEFINEAKCPGIKIGGVLNVVRYEVALNCPAIAIPEKITIDLDGVKIGDSIHISAIPLPEGVTPTITDRDFTVATLASPGGGVKNEDEEAEEEVTEEDGEEE